MLTNFSLFYRECFALNDNEMISTAIANDNCTPTAIYTPYCERPNEIIVNCNSLLSLEDEHSISLNRFGLLNRIPNLECGIKKALGKNTYMTTELISH